MTTKNRTVGDILDELGGLERKRAVYEDVVLFLSQFISTDTHQPQKGIKSPIGGEEVIPEDIIELVRAEQQDQIAEIAKEISALRGRPTQGSKASPKKTPAKKKAPKRKAPRKRRTNVKGKRQGPKED